MAPETKGMAQFMQAGGLNGCLRLPGADQHGHQRLEGPALIPVDFTQLKQGPSIAGAVIQQGADAAPPERGPAAAR